jgi:macrolide-specific efflux system membrane fusion protein
VLSDRLIVRAQVDETDIGKVKQDQDAIVSLDAYPDTKIKAKVDHIYYESKTVNNVTIYEVDLLLESVPDFFRSGMNATINFIENSKDNILLLSLEAVTKEGGKSFVFIKNPDSGDLEEKEVILGLSDDKNAEIISGLSENDTVVIKSKKYTLPKNSLKTNPFMPVRPQRASSQKPQK